MLVQLSNGQLLLLEGDELSLTLGLSTAAWERLQGGPGGAAAGPPASVSAGCLFADGTGWLDAALRGGTAAPPPEPRGTAAAVKREEEEEGAGGALGFAGADAGGERGGEHQPAGEAVAEEAAAPPRRHFLAVARVDGALEVLSLPEALPAFCVRQCGAGAELLLHEEPPGGGAAARAAGPPAGAPTRVVELRVESFKVRALCCFQKSLSVVSLSWQGRCLWNSRWGRSLSCGRCLGKGRGQPNAAQACLGAARRAISAFSPHTPKEAPLCLPRHPLSPPPNLEEAPLCLPRRAARLPCAGGGGRRRARVRAAGAGGSDGRGHAAGVPGLRPGGRAARARVGAAAARRAASRCVY